MTDAAVLPHKGWTVGLASVGVFMAALDALVVTTALPVLRTSLNASVDELEWTINAYVLTFACLLLPAAALAERYGRRLLFAIGLAIFAISSGFAAVSPTIEFLIAARAVEGLGAAIIMPVSLTLISHAFPMEKRGSAIAMWGAVSGVAVAIGPVFGGAVVEGLSWHWIFWVNVPVGLIAAALSMSRLTESFGPKRPLDLIGLAIACVGFFTLVWGLVRVAAVGWGSTEVIVAIIIGIITIAVFLIVEGKRANPMIELDLFRNRAFNSSSWVTFFMYAPLFGALFLMSQFLQSGLGDSPLEAGLHLLAWTGISMFIAPVVGPLSDKYGNRPFMIIGMAFQAIGFGWLALWADPNMGLGQLIGPLLAAGIGIGIVFPTVANGVMTSVTPDRIGVASGTSSTLRELGAVLGVALAGSIFADPNNYTNHATLVSNFSNSMWFCAIFSAIGALVAMAYPSLSDLRESLGVSVPTEDAASLPGAVNTSN